jgi:osmotically-inducible protein OsmY
LLYDLVINTEAVTLETGVKHVLDLAAAPEFQPTEASRAALWNRAVAARVRATLNANQTTRAVDLDVRAAEGQVVLAGVVGSEAERDAALTVTRGVRGVVAVVDDVKIFRRPVR